MGELLKARDAADRLGVHVATLYKWVALGHIEALRLPSGELRLQADELAQLLVKNKGGARPCSNKQSD